MQIVIGTFPFVLHYNATMLLPKIGSALHAHAAADGNSAERILRLGSLYFRVLNVEFAFEHCVQPSNCKWMRLVLVAKLGCPH